MIGGTWFFAVSKMGKYQALWPHIVSIVGQNVKLCPPLEAPLGEHDQNEGGEKKEKHLLAWESPDPDGLGGSTLQVNQMGPRGRLTLGRHWR